jgi:hypothetical protein
MMKNILINIIEKYQKNLSPIISKHGVNCRFYPTCSEYTKQAILKYGCILGIFKGLKRILRCNPFFKGGYDPLK